jgi:hypothetical protein
MRLHSFLCLDFIAVSHFHLHTIYKNWLALANFIHIFDFLWWFHIIPPKNHWLLSAYSQLSHPRILEFTSILSIRICTTSMKYNYNTNSNYHSLNYEPYHSHSHNSIPPNYTLLYRQFHMINNFIIACALSSPSSRSIEKNKNSVLLRTINAHGKR